LNNPEALTCALGSFMNRFSKSQHSLAYFRTGSEGKNPRRRAV
jgi:hypothetical protein